MVGVVDVEGQGVDDRVRVGLHPGNLETNLEETEVGILQVCSKCVFLFPMSFSNFFSMCTFTLVVFTNFTTWYKIITPFHR